MLAKSEIGRTYRSQSRVEEWMTAEKAGNPGIAVLATSTLVRLVEEAAIQCVQPILAAEEALLTASVDVTHIAPTPVGLIVRIEVEIVSIEGRRVDFAIGAFDEREKIAEGTMECAIVLRQKFRATLEEKVSG